MPLVSNLVERSPPKIIESSLQVSLAQRSVIRSTDRCNERFDQSVAKFPRIEQAVVEVENDRCDWWVNHRSSFW
jgi:hypothetical protein